MQQVIVSGKTLEGLSASIEIEHDIASISNPRLIMGEEKRPLATRSGVLIYSDKEALPRYYYWTGERLARYSVFERAAGGGLWEPLSVAQLRNNVIYFGGQFSIAREIIKALANTGIEDEQDYSDFVDKEVEGRIKEESRMFSHAISQRICNAWRDTKKIIEIDESENAANKRRAEWKKKHLHKRPKKNEKLTLFQKKLLSIQLSDYFVEFFSAEEKDKKLKYIQLLKNILTLDLSLLQHKEEDSDEEQELKSIALGLSNYVLPIKVNTISFREPKKPMIAEVISYCRWIIAIEIARISGIFPEKELYHERARAFIIDVKKNRIGMLPDAFNSMLGLSNQEQEIFNTVCLMSQDFFAAETLHEKDIAFLEQVFLVAQSIVRKKAPAQYRDILDNFVVFAIETPEEDVQKNIGTNLILVKRKIELLKKLTEIHADNDEIIQLDLDDFLFVLEKTPKEKLLIVLGKIEKSTYAENFFKNKRTASDVSKAIRKCYGQDHELMLVALAIKKQLPVESLGYLFSTFSLSKQWPVLLCKYKNEIAAALSTKENLVRFLKGLEKFSDRKHFLRLFDVDAVVRTPGDLQYLSEKIIDSVGNFTEIYNMFMSHLLAMVGDNKKNLEDAIQLLPPQDKTIFRNEFNRRKIFQEQKRAFEKWDNKKDIISNVNVVLNGLCKNEKTDKNAVASILGALPKENDPQAIRKHLNRVLASISKIHSHQPVITRIELAVEYCIKQIGTMPLYIKVVYAVKSKIPICINAIERYIAAVSNMAAINSSLLHRTFVSPTSNKSLELAKALQNSGGLNEVLAFLDVLVADGIVAPIKELVKELAAILGGVYPEWANNSSENYSDLLRHIIEVVREQINRELVLEAAQAVSPRNTLCA